MRFRLTCLVVLACVVSGCRSPTCEDPDFDGYGPHCSLGEDCDANNAARNVDCVGVLPPDCDATPEAPGCPCFSGTSSRCYLGPAPTENVGVCQAGRSFCVNGFYGLCNGDVSPNVDRCNGVDDDCDGHVDELVLSPCGGCDASCTGSVWGPGGTPFTVRPGLVTTEQGALTLDRTPVSFDGVWITNDGEDTVSHVSASSATEVARHASGGIEPTRVAVDHRGDVFVANLARGAQGTLTKLGGTPAGCVDRNGMNGIETSTGPLDVPSVAADECIVYSVSVGAVGEMPRSVSVDGSFEPGGGGGGDPWIGLYDGEAVVHLDGETGMLVERVELPGFRPFTSTFDGRGALWLASQEGELVRVDRSTSPPTATRILVNLACYSIYDIAVADDESIVATGFGCDQLFRFDPRDRRVNTLASLESSRGVVTLEGEAFAVHADGRMSVVTDDLRERLAIIDSWTLGAMPVESIGVATDSLGFVWMWSASGGTSGNGVATRIDPATRTVTSHVTIGESPRTLGDATGGRLRGAFVPMGATSVVVAGCGGGTNTGWQALHVDLDPGSASTAILDVRWAPSESSLPSETFTTVGTFPGSSVDLPLTSLPQGGVIELRLTLSSDARDSAPLVRQVGVEYACILE